MQKVHLLEADLEHPNIKAFLILIRKAEGTSSNNGYRYLFGSSPRNEKLFDSYYDHPSMYIEFKNKKGETLVTSAAGAYQFLFRTWDRIRTRLGLQDFSPKSQDLAAIELLYEAGATDDIKKGSLRSALQKVCKVWASLPGAGYDQPEHSFSEVVQWYKNAGGKARLSQIDRLRLSYYLFIKRCTKIIKHTHLFKLYSSVKKYFSLQR